MKTAEETIKSNPILRTIIIDGNEEYRGGVIEQAIEDVMEEYASQDKWVSVEERFPEEQTLVLIATQVGGTSTCYQTNGIWRYAYNSSIVDMVLTVTHWQPLPTSPKK